MRNLVLRAGALLAAGFLGSAAYAQRAYTWEQLRDRFLAENRQLQAGQIGIQESRADEVTASLRPNPQLSFSVDQLGVFQSNPYYRPLGSALPLVSWAYLKERGHKRELRTESAKQATDIAISQQSDLERTLIFNLRNSFVQALQFNALLDTAKESLGYYDRQLDVNRERLRSGDIAQVDFDRIELQRVQFETDVQTFAVNLRTAKIQLLALMNDRTPVDRFEVSGTFDYAEPAISLDELHRVALASRPDLRAADQGITKAKTDYRLAVANGTSDPSFGMDLARDPDLKSYVGFSMDIPLRIFDRNQGEKARTLADIRRNERLRDAAETQVLSDVDSAYATLNSNLALLRPYKTKYLPLATRVRDTVSFAYQRGASSLLDFLQAQNDYRTTQVAYLNLVGAYMTAASQLNLAVGREVIR